MHVLAILRLQDSLRRLPTSVATEDGMAIPFAGRADPEDPRMAALGHGGCTRRRDHHWPPCSSRFGVAARVINAPGGVLGRAVVLLIEDNKSDPKEAATAAEKLI